jgi:hypothetical protein
MGRGLSELQKTILRIAWRNREAERRHDGSGGGDVVYAEVLAEHYGWHPSRCRLQAPSYEKEDEERRTFGSQHFAKEIIGERVYNAAHAALTRAMTRLATRGLVTLVYGVNSRWSGANLTADGVRLARGTPLPIETVGEQETPANSEHKEQR